MTYKANFYCDNCDKYVKAEIKKGTTRKEYVENHSCPTCGCSTLRIRTVFNIDKEKYSGPYHVPYIPYDKQEFPWDNQDEIIMYEKEPCMFDNLEPGVYGISCPCPNCTPRC